VFKPTLSFLGAAIMALSASAALSQEQRFIDGQMYRDPTQPLGAQRLQGFDGRMTIRRSYQVSFIRTGGERPVAVVNGTAVSIGDEIEGARVLQISGDAVTLRVDGEELVITTRNNTAGRSAP
jgi:hypothetical protein